MSLFKSYRFQVSCTMIGIFIISSCKDKDEDISMLIASAGDNINVQVGETVVLDGEDSKDLAGNPFEYSWSFISKPAASDAVLENNTTGTPSFTPDIQGKYKIELVISNTAEERDTVTVSAFKVIVVEGNYENIIPGPNVGIRDFAVAGNNLFATCEFTEIGGIAANKIARYNGAVWNALGCGLEEGSIFEMIEYKGELYVTGQFDEIGCIPAANIARWSFENNTWRDVEGGLTGGNDPYGYTLAVYNDELYVGGLFEKAGNVNSINIAKWNGTEWLAVGNTDGGSVRELMVYKQRLYAGGFFDAVNGIVTGHIASYDGSNWNSVGSLNDLELGATGVVRHMVVYKDLLYISGNFSSDEGDFSEVITWDGLTFSDFGTAFSLYQNIISELVVITGKLYIGGSFNNVIGSQANNILQWDGESWGIMSEGISGSVLSIEWFDNKIYIGGDFNAAGGNNAENISIWTEQ